jgi:hypothetical protein
MAMGSNFAIYRFGRGRRIARCFALLTISAATTAPTAAAKSVSVAAWVVTVISADISLNLFRCYSTWRGLRYLLWPRF